MAEQEQSHLKELYEFRQVLLAHRRNIVFTALDLRAANARVSDVQPWYGAQWGKDFLEVQQQINAVDEAISEEETY